MFIGLAVDFGSRVLFPECETLHSLSHLKLLLIAAPDTLRTVGTGIVIASVIGVILFLAISECMVARAVLSQLQAQ